jgi:hypothetical protein
MTTYYVVRHKVTGKILPQTFMTGSTWWHPEPEETRINQKELPRLFYSERAGTNFINMWAKGHAVKHRASSFDFEGNEDNDEWLEWEAVSGRSRSQLEVVPVTLQFGA